MIADSMKASPPNRPLEAPAIPREYEEEPFFIGYQLLCWVSRLRSSSRKVVVILQKREALVALWGP
jgi:hypothetical protein